MRILCSAGLALMLLAPAWAGVQVGGPAPDFTLPDENGTRHKLSQYRGRIVVLEWTNPQCPFVQEHYQNKTMIRLYERYRSQDVVWLAVNSSHFNKPADTRRWAQENGIPYPTLQDPEGTVGRLYGAQTTPHMFVIDRNGTLVYRGAIDNAYDPDRDQAGPVNYVEQVLDALLRGERPPVRETKPYGCTVKYKPSATS
ncbi:MAG: thioredoxin family protein [Acidobacteria bacterium]|nr:thioredoxin family protein [Acidobacteriota bacterium]MDW7984556.1 thioredoxin family protein [Acidobacteriota bacterium]